MINMIWAQGTNGELGLNGQLPWKLPADMKYFKETTMGSIVVMGRKTYESLNKPLEGRLNVVLTREPEPTWVRPGDWVYDSHIKLLNDIGKCKAFIIGGKEIYNLFMPFADELYVTHIHEAFEADTYATSIPRHFRLDSFSEGTVDYMNLYPHSFTIYRKQQIGGK